MPVLCRGGFALDSSHRAVRLYLARFERIYSVRLGESSKTTLDPERRQEKSLDPNPTPVPRHQAALPPRHRPLPPRRLLRDVRRRRQALRPRARPNPNVQADGQEPPRPPRRHPLPRPRRLPGAAHRQGLQGRDLRADGRPGDGEGPRRPPGGARRHARHGHRRPPARRARQQLPRRPRRRAAAEARPRRSRRAAGRDRLC